VFSPTLFYALLSIIIHAIVLLITLNREIVSQAPAAADDDEEEEDEEEEDEDEDEDEDDKEEAKDNDDDEEDEEEEVEKVDLKVHKKKVVSEPEDENLECRDCGAEFVFTVGEQDFFKEKGFDNKPTRCGDCKAAKKGAHLFQHDIINLFVSKSSFSKYILLWLAETQSS